MSTEKNTLTNGNDPARAAALMKALSIDALAGQSAKKLSGGETAAIVVLDAIVRLLPGVMGNAQSGETESFETGLLEHPQYTKPQEWEGRRIPDVLLSGNHGAIEKWRRAEAEKLTQERRPDLWDRYPQARKPRK